jgi:RNA polymerase-interacting CarD/CdnL/TRCF family regulator
LDEKNKDRETKRQQLYSSANSIMRRELENSRVSTANKLVKLRKEKAESKQNQ